MHDPSFLLAWPHRLGLDIWHDEPGGHDAGTRCGWPPQHGVKRTVWGIRHIRHLRLNWWPYLNVKRWLVDRCGDCGKRFRWREARHSYQSTDEVWHDVCMSLRHVRSDLDDLTAYVQFTGDPDTRWRAEYRLSGLPTTPDTDGDEKP